MNNIPKNEAAQNSDAARQRNRHNLYLYSLVPVCAAVIIAVIMFAPGIAYARYDAAFKAGEYTKAIRWIAMLKILPIEQHKTYFNIGTANIELAAYDEAERDLRASLSTAPLDFECAVRINLSISLMRKADDLLEAKNYDDAILVYDQLRAVVDERDCGLTINNQDSEQSDGDNDDDEKVKEEDEQLQEQREQADKQQNKAKQARNGEKSDDTSDESEESDDENQPDQEQLDQLQKQQSENYQKSRKREQQQRDQSQDNYSDYKYGEKNW